MNESRNYSRVMAPYLNQTSHFIMKGDSTIAYLINTPYKIGRSVLGAINSQYYHAFEATEYSPAFRHFLNILAFLFSGYAFTCFATAMVLNRIVATSNSRSRHNQIYIAPTLRRILHITCIVPLVVLSICMTLDLQVVMSLSHFWFNFYLVIVWSYVMETVTSVSTGQIPLETTDYTIFEQSLQLYAIAQLDERTILENGYAIDCVVALLSRLLIHIVELFNVRSWRLMGSTFINVGYLIYLAEHVYRRGTNSLSFSTKFRQAPKLFGILMIVLSFSAYFLACLVRYNPFDNRPMNLEQLKFNSFMKNWVSHTNFKGDEDFPTIVQRLATLLCMGSNTSDRAMQKEFSSIVVPSRIHRSYAISETLFQAKESLHSSHGKRGEDRIARSLGYRMIHRIIDYIKRNGIWNSIVGILFRTDPYDEVGRVNEAYLDDSSENNTDSSDNAELLHIEEYDESTDDEDMTNEDIEDVCIATSYAKYLLQDSDEKLDEMSSDDDEYIPMNDEDARGTPVPFISESTTLEETPLDEPIEAALDNQIDIINLRSLTSDIGWFFSLKNIFNFHLTHAERITRSKYSESMAHIHDNDKKPQFSSDSDFLCAVCKTNKRDIILWPCNCFAMCNACRVSLALRNYETCVCCRSRIDGFSRVTEVDTL